MSNTLITVLALVALGVLIAKPGPTPRAQPKPVECKQVREKLEQHQRVSPSMWVNPYPMQEARVLH